MSEFKPIFKVRRSAGSPESPVAVFSGSSVWLRQGGADAPPRLPRRAEFPELGEQELVELGELNGQVALAFQGEVAPGDGLEAYELRQALMLLSPGERAMLMRGKPVLNWLSVRHYCGVCGTVLEDSPDEEARACPKCATLFFPKISPAVIVAVTRKDEILLAHNRKFRDGLYSLIAGFVEPGESAEAAVARELAEEVGVRVENITYAGSQSWPFPDSLMLGFFAEYAGGDITPDGDEITDADFFTRDNLPTLPGPGSIAYRILTAWRQGGRTI